MYRIKNVNSNFIITPLPFTHAGVTPSVPRGPTRPHFRFLYLFLVGKNRVSGLKLSKFLILTNVEARSWIFLGVSQCRSSNLSYQKWSSFSALVGKYNFELTVVTQVRPIKYDRTAVKMQKANLLFRRTANSSDKLVNTFSSKANCKRKTAKCANKNTNPNLEILETRIT